MNNPNDFKPGKWIIPYGGDINSPGAMPIIEEPVLFINNIDTNEKLSFDDVLILPKFSMIESRKDVSISTNFLGLELETPIISSNMDTVTSHRMAIEMGLNGAVGALHRFMSVIDNVDAYLRSKDKLAKNLPIISIGIGKDEIGRAVVLKEAGATHFLIDVAHGAAMHVVNQYNSLREKLGDEVKIIVGNFANKEGIETFNKYVKSNKKPDAFKVGIGGGSLCTTRIVTGCGLPTFASIVDCSRTGYPIIADGGIRSSGDMAKALAAGADVVMLGQLLAGTYETPGEIIYPESLDGKSCPMKSYRGSASLESYGAQGKLANHRAPEGEATLIPYKGPVADVLATLSGGLRSSLSYVGAKDLTEFRNNATLVKVSSNSVLESKAHAKRD